MENSKIKPCKKLIPHLYKHEKYCLHYRNLKFIHELGVKITKIHNVITFSQKPWMKSYIDFNTEKRKEAKNELAKSLGADATVDANSTDLAAAMIAANGGKRVDIVLEMVGGKTFDSSLEVLAPFGRLITFGMASRTAPTAIHPGVLMGGTKTVAGFWLSHCFGKKELMGDVLSELFVLISSGALKPVIGATYGLSEAKLAHQAMLARQTTGKVTLDPRR
jgi:NADPH:quinone reductase-like Zn-dependent oxidoreductase